MTDAVPAQFRVLGKKPEAAKAKCKICKLPYTAHSGTTCAICKGAVEHHTAEQFDECCDGRRRMARARYLADVPLDKIDELVLANG